MTTSRRRRSTNALFFGTCLTACLALSIFASRDGRPGPILDEPSQMDGACIKSAEKRLHNFVRTIDRSCDDPHRQRICHERLSQQAIPELSKSRIDKSCDDGCLFHAVISEAGGKALNRLAFSAFLRAFIVTQSQQSKLIIWSLPWDDITLPDITHGCPAQTLNEKLRVERWKRRIQIKRVERAELGTLNLLRMMTYRLVGNDFRLMRSMVRLSDMLRFHLLRKNGGIYIDSDVLLLHDLSPLCNSTFTYQWSNKDAENSAVFGCPENCPFVNDYIRSAGSAPLSYHPLKWRRVGRDSVRSWPVRLPTMVFDPVWLKQIGYDSYDPADYLFTKHEDFVKADVDKERITNRSSVFPASLGYHWHGGFASIPKTGEPGSTFSQLHDLACS